MPLQRLEPSIPASELPQNQTLYRVFTRVGPDTNCEFKKSQFFAEFASTCLSNLEHSECRISKLLSFCRLLDFAARSSRTALLTLATPMFETSRVFPRQGTGYLNPLNIELNPICQ